MFINKLILKIRFLNIKFFLLAIIPFAFCLGCFSYLNSGFYPIYSNPIELDQDPAYIYLFSGLGLLHGLNPMHTDHPGTPYQIFFAFIILFNFLKTIFSDFSFFSSEGITFSTLDSVTVKDTEFILKIASSFSIIFISFLIFCLSLVIYKNFRSLIGAIISQCFIFLLSDTNNKQIYRSSGNLILNRTIYPGPEQFLIIISLITLIFITISIKSLYFEKSTIPTSNEKNLFWILGGLFSTGIYTKVTFITFFPILYLFKGSRLVNILKGIVSFSIFYTFIIGDRIGYSLYWFLNNLIKKERYGGGEIGFFQSESIAKAFKITFMSGYSYISIFIIFIFLAFIFKIIISKTNSNVNLGLNDKNLLNYKFIFLLIISFSIGIILLFKNPVSRYFLPTIILFSYYLSIIFSINKINVIKSKKINQLFLKKENIFIPTIFISLLVSLIFKISLLANNEIKLNRLNPPINEDVKNIISNNSTLCFYRFPTKNCSIAFALIYNKNLAGNKVFDGIKAIVGNQIRDFASNKEFEYLSKKPTKNINSDVLLLSKKYKFPFELSPAIKNKNLIYENQKVSLYSVEYYLK